MFHPHTANCPKRPRDTDAFTHPEQLRREFAGHPSVGQTYGVLIDTEAQFRRMEVLWRGLHAAGPVPSPFASWDWVWDWWRVFGRVARDGGEASGLLLVAVMTTDHDLIGLFPFHHPVGLRRVGSLRALRSFGRLGKNYEAMTEEPSLLLKPGAERRATESALWLLLRCRQRAAWDCVDFWVQHSEEALMEAPPAPGSGLRSRLQHRKVLPVLELTLPPSWETLRKTLSRSMRDNIGYYPRLLKRRGHAWEVAFVTDPGEIAHEADVLTMLHRQREGGRMQAVYGGHLPSAVHRHFLRDRLSAMAREGGASIAVMRIDGTPVASQALLQRGEAVLFYYSGFSPDWSAFSPMTILQSEIFAHLIGQSVARVNLLAYEYSWKTRWGARQTERLQQLNYVRRRPVSWTRVWLYSRREKVLRDPIEFPAPASLGPSPPGRSEQPSFQTHTFPAA